MKILVGGNGTIGWSIVTHFKEKNEFITAGRKNGDVKVDIADSASIKNMYEQVGNVDAIICAAEVKKIIISD